MTDQPIEPVPPTDGFRVPKPDPAAPTDIDQTFQKILNTELYPTANQTPVQQQHFIRQYSWAALILNFVYYEAMGDQLLAWLSAIASLTVLLIPLLAVFPIWARARAYHGKRRWQSFGQFEQNQKNWDRAAWASLVGVLAVFYLLLRYWGPNILNELKQVDSLSSSYNVTTNQSANSQVQQFKSGLQQELGQ